MGSHILYVNNLPSRYGLFTVQQLIDALLNEPDGVRSIDYVKCEDGSSSDSVAEVRLRSRECFNKLLQRGVIALEYEGQPRIVQITDQSPFGKPEDEDSDDDPGHSHSDIEHRALEWPEAEHSVPDDESTKTAFELRQVCLYCYDIPRFMFTKQKLMDHLKQFGSVIRLFVPGYLRPDRSPFARVEFDCHESAKLALERAGYFGRERMRVEWDWEEMARIRQQLSARNEGHNTTYHENQEPTPIVSSVGQRSNVENVQSGPAPPKPRPRKSKSSASFTSSDLPEPVVMHRNVSSPGLSADAPLPIVTWHEILQTDKKLMQGNPNRAVLVQSSTKDLSEDRLRNYFMNEGFCGKEKIEKVYKLNDGLLVVFSHADIAKQVLKVAKHVIDSEKVKVFPKIIPSIFDDRFIIEGTFSDADEVETLLGCCDVDSDATHNISELDQQHKFLVKYDKKVDIEQLIDAIETTPLEETQVQAKRECRTDCIKVENLHGGISNDVIRLTFMNRKNGCTGKVTKVEKVVQEEDLLVFVYFANFADAKNVVDKSKTREIVVSGVAVGVSLYHYSMYNDHQGSKTPKPNLPRPVEKKVPVVAPAAQSTATRRPVKLFEYTPKVKEGVMKYIQHFAEVEQVLEQELEDVADVSILAKSSAKSDTSMVISVKPALERMSREYKYSQSKFRSECSSLLDTFFNKFTTTSATYDDKSLSDLRRCSSWNEDSGFINVEVDDNKAIDVYVRWNNLGPGHITVTGWSSEVVQVLRYIKQKCDVCEDSLSFNESIFRAMLECRAVDQIKDEFQTSLKVTDDAKTLTLIFKGPRTEVAKAKTRASDIKLELKTRAVPDLGNISKFLYASLRNDKSDSTNMVDIREIIQAEFDKEKICASLQLEDDEIYLLYTKQSEMGRAQKALMEMIKQRTISMSEGFDELVNSSEWKRFIQNRCSSGSVRIFTDKKSSTIIVAGLSYTFEENFNHVNEYVNSNAIITSLLEQSYVVVLYFRTYMESVAEEGKSCLDKVDLQWKLDYSEQEAAISIRGKMSDIEKASQWFHQVITRFCIMIHEISDPGMPEYFRSEKGKGDVKAIERKHRCIAIVDPAEWQTRAPRRLPKQQKLGSKVKLGSEAKLEVIVPHTRNVTIRLVQNDITESDCDAMVNASNEDLDLRSAGVSGSIVKKGGHAIQNEMSSYKSKHGKLRPGLVATTNAGKLSFKKMIHAVGPMWNPNSSFENQRDLKKCVKNSLQEASLHNLKSIAIPAISCGVFGGKPDVCVPLMVKAAVDFVQENDESTVKQIDFVEMSNSKIINEFDKALRAIDGVVVEAPARQNIRKSGNTSSTFFSKPKFRSSRSEHIQSITLTVCQGDISTFQASVLVTSTAPAFMRSGGATAITKALYKNAGPELQAASKAIMASAKFKVGDVFPTPGFNLNCKEVYHVVLADYDSTNGNKILTEAIESCLSMADASGHSSIAFPILGGGGFGYPASLIMKTFHDVFQQFEARLLRKGTLVIFPTDTASLQAAQNNLSVSIAPDPRPRASTKTQAGSGWTNLQISVKSGDLLASQCDVIVNSTSQFNMTGQVGKLIVARGGQTIANECANNPVKSSACFRVTSAGNLPSKYIIHVDTPKDTNLLVVVLGEVLKAADELKMKSIGFPAIGSGGIGLASDDVAKCMRKAFDSFDKSNSKYLHDIEVWIFQQNMLADFQQHVLGGSQSASVTQSTKGQSMFGKMKEIFGFSSEKDDVEANKPASLLPVAGSSVDKESVSILLCSHEEENVVEARQSVDEKVTDLTLTKKIEDEVLRELTPPEELELLEISKKYKVKIERTASQSRVTTLVISGLNRNVYEAYNASNDLIHQLKNALICSQYVIWKHKDKSGEMKEFPLRASNELEQAYKKDSKGSLQLDISIDSYKQPFLVDFKKMENTCLTDNKKTKVERCTVSDAVDPVPATWEDMGGKPWKKVAVKQGSTEYMTVIGKFNATAQFNAVQLERIQNPTLYKQFQAQKKKVADRMTKSGSTLPVTLELFHGTSSDVCPNIFKDGFDRSHAGRNATMYGRGVYFAITSQYSVNYARPDGNGQKRMFLTEVITGEYCQGNQSMVTVPMQANGSPYDSVVDNTGNPSMYVVFKDASVYPSYMLTFT